MSTAVLCACIAVLVPVIDQLTKYLVRSYMNVGDQIPVLGEFFKISYILNEGAAFGKMGGAWRWVFMIATPVFLTIIVVYLVKNVKTTDKLSAAALSLIFGGGLSNMIDRIFFINLTDPPTKLFNGRVIDFLDFNVTVFGHRIWSYVFNVADACVVIGVFLFLIAYAIGALKERKTAKAGAGPVGEHTVTSVYKSFDDRESAQNKTSGADEATDASLETNGAVGAESAPDGGGLSGESGGGSEGEPLVSGEEGAAAEGAAGEGGDGE